jgi:hypothetical protein
MLMLDSAAGAEHTNGRVEAEKPVPAKVGAQAGSRGKGRAAEPREADDEDELPF